MAAPSFAAEVEVTSWDTAKNNETSPFLNVTAGDVLVLVGGSEDANTTLTGVSGGSLTWTLQQSVVVASNATAYVWTAVVDADKAMTVTVDASNATSRWGYSLIRFTASGGVGASAKTNSTGAPSLGITTTGANSAIVVLVGDWDVADGTSRIWRTVNTVTPTLANGMERVYFRNSAAYTTYAAYWSDAGSAGAKTVGLSAPGGQKYAIVAVEVLGTSATHTQTPTDSAGLTDALALSRTRVDTDAAGLSDAVTLTVTRPATFTDDAGLSDTVTIARRIGVDLNDPAGLADPLGLQLTRVLQLDDTAGTTDGLAASLTVNRTVDDGAGLSDALSTSGTPTINLNDPAGITDTLGIARQIALTLDDTAGLAEACAMGTVYALAVSDTTGLSDAVFTAGFLGPQATDDTGLTDPLVLAVTRALTLDDFAGPADSASLTALTPAQTFTDSAGMADGLILTGGAPAMTRGVIGPGSRPGPGASRRVREAPGMSPRHRPSTSMGGGT